MLNLSLAPLLTAFLLQATAANGGMSFTVPSARATGWISPETIPAKVLYVEIARTNCSRCDAGAPALMELRRKYQPQGLEILSVYDELPSPGGDDPFERVLAHITKKGFEHPVGLNDGGEFHGLFYSKIKGTPSAFLVNKAGRVEFLGLDPLAPGAKEKTTARIETFLSEDPVSAPVATRPGLQPFSLLMYSGGIVRTAEMTGKPTVLVTWLPGPLMERLGPELEILQKSCASVARIIAVTFGEFEVAAAAAARLCPSVALAAPDSRATAALDATRLPQLIFLDTNGKIAKRITTLYGPGGVERHMMERAIRALVEEAGMNPVVIQKNARPVRIRDVQAGASFLLPAGFTAAQPSADSSVEFVSSNARFRSRIHAGPGGQSEIERIRTSISENSRDYKVTSEETLPNGAILLSDECQLDGGPRKFMRFFVNTRHGILELQLSAPTADFDQFEDDFRESTASISVDQ